MQGYLADETFNYTKAKSKAPSLWSRFLDWFYDTFYKPFKDINISGDFDLVDLLMWVVFIGALLLALKLFLGMDARSLFRKKASVIIPSTSYTEDINTIDFNAEILEAHSQGQYRKAVRLYYLWVLKRLADEGTIEWKQDKTNADFLAEMRNNPTHSTFKRLTEAFNRFWYGEFPLSEQLYTETRKDFDSYLQELNRS